MHQIRVSDRITSVTYPIEELPQLWYAKFFFVGM
jgi:hypothetical protein